MPAYTVSEDAVRHAKGLIDARQYVLRSRWQNVQPRAGEQNAFLKTHSREEYAAWHQRLRLHGRAKRRLLWVNIGTKAARLDPAGKHPPRSLALSRSACLGP